MKKILLSILAFCSILVFLIFILKNCHAQSNSLRLKSKADSALVFCKQKDFSTEYCILIDMKIHSGKNRFFVWNFPKEEITYSGLCAHGLGKGSTPEKPVFSNEVGSNCTSLGKYKIGIRSYSRWGINVHYKLHGLEKSNNNAFKRIVVLHSFNPVSVNEIYPFYLPMGYSEGCPVICNTLMRSIDTLLQNSKKPVLLWIYY